MEEKKKQNFLVSVPKDSKTEIYLVSAARLSDVRFYFRDEFLAWISQADKKTVAQAAALVDGIITAEPAPEDWKPEKPAADPDGHRYFNQNNLYRIKRAICHYETLIERGIELHVTISAGNDKIGKVKNVSLVPYLTCDFNICKESCGPECYAGKLAAIYGPALNAWAKNTALAKRKPDQFWADISKAITKRCKYFRFHVAGDVIDREYLENLITLVESKPWCRFWTYTKKWSLYNRYADRLKKLENFAVLYSGWNDLKPINPFGFIETDVLEPGAPVPADWFLCPGNCQQCIDNNTGCIVARIGGKIVKIVFYKH